MQGLRQNENGNSPMVARVLTDVMPVLIHSLLKAAIKHLVSLLYIHSYPDISFFPALVIIQATHHRLFDLCSLLVRMFISINLQMDWRCITFTLCLLMWPNLHMRLTA